MILCHLVPRRLRPRHQSHDQETCDSCQDDASCATPIRYQSERKQADLISVSVTMPCARENDGRKLDHQTLEVMRLRAVDGSSPGCTRRMSRRRWAWAGARCMAGWRATGRRPGGAEGPPGAGAAAEAVRRADAPALDADRRDRSAAAGVRVRAVDPGHAAHADPPRVSGVAVGGQRRSAAAHPGLVAAAAPVAGLAGRPRRCAALARRGLPGDPRAGQGRGRHGVLRRRGRDPLGPPRPSWSNSSLPPPTGDCDCSCCPPTPRNSTPTSGSGRTSSTTGSGAPASTTPTSSRPRSWVRYDACRNCPRLSGHSSLTRTCATSQHDQSQLTNDLLSKVVCTR